MFLLVFMPLCAAPQRKSFEVGNDYIKRDRQRTCTSAFASPHRLILCRSDVSRELFQSQTLFRHSLATGSDVARSHHRALQRLVLCRSDVSREHFSANTTCNGKARD